MMIEGQQTATPCRTPVIVDRGRVDVVDDDRGMLVKEPKQLKHYSACIQNAK